MTKTLLDVAKETHVRTNKRVENIYTKELAELCVAYVTNTISMAQFIVGINVVFAKISGGNALYKVAAILKEAYRRGELEIHVK